MNLRKTYVMSVCIKIIIVMLSFLDTVIINRVLTVSARGEYGVAVNTITILNLVMSFGIGASYQLFYKRGEQVKKLFISLITLQAIIYFFASTIYFALSRNTWNFLMLIVAISLILRDHISSINLVENISKRNYIYLSSSIIYTLLLLLLSYVFGFSNVYVYLGLQIVRYLIEVVISLPSQKYYSQISFHSLKEIKLIKEILASSFSITILAILITCNYNIDVIMLNMYDIDSYNIGLYSVAATLLNIAWILPDAFKDVIINRLSRFDAKNEVQKTLKLNLILCGCILIGFWLFGKTFISVFYGDKYMGSYYLTCILLIGSLPMACYKLINPYLLSIGKKNLAIIFLSISVIVNVISNMIVIPLYGERGAAFSSVLSYSICGGLYLIFFLYFQKKRTKKSVDESSAFIQ